MGLADVAGQAMAPRPAHSCHPKPIQYYRRRGRFVHRRLLSGIVRDNRRCGHEARLDRYISGDASKAFLMTMEGETVHQWSCDFAKIWPDYKPPPKVEGMRRHAWPEFWRRLCVSAPSQSQYADHGDGRRAGHRSDSHQRDRFGIQQSGTHREGRPTDRNGKRGRSHRRPSAVGLAQTRRRSVNAAQLTHSLEQLRRGAHCAPLVPPADTVRSRLAILQMIYRAVFALMPRTRNRARLD